MFTWRSIGHSYYHALEATLRRHAAGLQFDLNYTFSKSIDMNSNAERVNEYENGGGSAVAYSGQTVNAWSPFALRAPSDYDLRHQLNANWMYELPLGRGRRFAAKDVHVRDRRLDAVIGEFLTRTGAMEQALRVLGSGPVAAAHPVALRPSAVRRWCAATSAECAARDRHR